MMSNRSVAKAGLLMAGVAALCRFVSLGKEVYVASVFGAGVAIDAYSLAIIVPAIGLVLFVNAIRRAFLVQYASRVAEGAESAESFANLFITNLIVAGVVVASLVYFLLPFLWPILLSSDQPDVMEVLNQVTLPMALLIVPMSLVGGMTSILNARGRFSGPQFTFVLPTLCIVAFVLLKSEWGTAALLWGLFYGSVLQSGVLFGMVGNSGHRLRLKFDFRSEVFRRLWIVSGALIVVEVVIQANVFIDRSMAGSLDEGSMSVLYWGAMMKDFFTATLFASFVTVLVPHFSGQIERGAHTEVSRSCALLLRYGAILMFPLSALLIVCGPPLLSHFRLGALDQSSLRSISYCLAAYGFGLFADMTGPPLMQVLVMLGRLRTLIVIAVFASLLPNVLLNLLLIGPFQEVGLAASTALVSCCVLACNYVVVRTAVGIDEETRTLKVVVGAAVAAVLMLLVGYAVVSLFGKNSAVIEMGQFIVAVIAGVAMMLVYGFLLFVFPGSRDARLAMKIAKETLNRRRSDS